MKKILLTMAAVGLAASVFAQGTVVFNNFVGATGLVQIDGVTAASGTQITVQLLYGAPGSAFADLTALTPVFTTTLVQDGKFYDATTRNLTGITAGSGSADTTMNAVLAIQGWVGDAADWDTAVAAGAKVGQTAVFDNPTGGGGAPPAAAANLVGWMADNPLNLTIVPEPTTFALLGLGALGMLAFRRK